MVYCISPFHDTTHRTVGACSFGIVCGVMLSRIVLCDRPILGESLVLRLALPRVPAICHFDAVLISSFLVFHLLEVGVEP